MYIKCFKALAARVCVTVLLSFTISYKQRRDDKLELALLRLKTCSGAVADPRRCVLTLIVQDRQTAARPGKNLGLLAFPEASLTPLKSNSEGACSSLNDKNEHL